MYRWKRTDIIVPWLPLPSSTEQSMLVSCDCSTHISAVINNTVCPTSEMMGFWLLLPAQHRALLTDCITYRVYAVNTGKVLISKAISFIPKQKQKISGQESTTQIDFYMHQNISNNLNYSVVVLLMTAIHSLQNSCSLIIQHKFITYDIHWRSWIHDSLQQHTWLLTDFF